MPILFDVAMTNLVNIAVTGQEAGAGIGGGNRGNGGTVRIEGGNVFAMSGLDNVPAIGRGINGSNDGSLSLYGTATVTTGSTVGSGDNAQIKTEKQTKANRVSACKQKKYATILPCSHDDTQLTDYGDSEYHKLVSCPWCEIDDQTPLPHEFDPATHTCKCGHKQYKLTLRQTGEGSVFISRVRDALKDGDSIWISGGARFFTTVWPASLGYAAAISATSGGTALSPTEQYCEFDPASGVRVDSSSDTMPNADVELNVVISEGISISFKKGDSNAGSTMRSVTCKPGEKYTIPECSFTAPQSKRFNGWKVTGPAGYTWGSGWDPAKIWQPGDKLSVPEDIALITLTAQWKRVPPKGAPLTRMYAKGKLLVITWTKMANVDGYDVFFSRCNHNGEVCAPKKVKTVKGDMALSATMKGLEPGKSYKAYVKAWVLEAGKKTYVKKSPTTHAFAAGKTKVKFSKSSIIVLKTSKASVRVGKTFQINASLGIAAKNHLFPTTHANILRYYSSNKKIAAVSQSGKVKGKSKGACKVYVIAPNGERKTVTIVVK